MIGNAASVAPRVREGAASVAKVSDEQREQIARELRHAERSGASLAAIARNAGVSVDTVRRVAAAIGVESNPERRARTQNATLATVQDNATRRAQLAKQLLDVAQEALADMGRPATIYNFGGKDNTYNERQVDRPPTGDRRNLATIAAIALDKHKMLDGYDADRSRAAAVDEWLGGMLGRQQSGAALEDGDE